LVTWLLMSLYFHTNRDINTVKFSWFFLCIKICRYFSCSLSMHLKIETRQWLMIIHWLDCVIWNCQYLTIFDLPKWQCPKAYPNLVECPVSNSEDDRLWSWLLYVSSVSLNSLLYTMWIKIPIIMVIGQFKGNNG
jgi:hypothetical protein